LDEGLSPAVISAAFGFGGGVLLGLAARLANFCTLAAIEDAFFGQTRRRLRMWSFALAVALASVALLTATGTVDFRQSLYYGIDLNPLSWIVGGIMFGFGMALCGTCAYGTLARIGGGDLRALFGFLILGLSAYMAVSGPTAELRILLLNPLSLEGIQARTFPELLGLDATGTLILTGLVVVALFAWAFAGPRFRSSPKHIVGAFAVGAAIVLGWIGTGWAAADPFDPIPVASHTYSYPLGQTLIYLMTTSNTEISFGVAATFGVVAGAFVGALWKREFRWDGADDAQEMRRHLVGAFLMGTGGVYAGGCTIGQGLTAASLLMISAPVVMASVCLGVWLGLTYLMDGGLIGRLFQRIGQ
jgi:uncharacterized membrane protein YedE/YeeE